MHTSRFLVVSRDFEFFVSLCVFVGFHGSNGFHMYICDIPKVPKNGGAGRNSSHLCNKICTGKLSTMCTILSNVNASN
jgi:hypothetical protein